MMDEEIRQALCEVREIKKMCGNINMKLTNIVTQRGQDIKKKLDAEYQKGFEDGKKEAESSDAIEQAKADAFNKGMLYKGEKMHDAYHRGLHEGNDLGYKDGVKDGRNEAWEAARKVALSTDDGGLSMEKIREIFTVYSMLDVFRTYSAVEVIEKLKAYEEKQDDKPIIGEVVERYLNGKRDGVGVFLGEDGDYWNCLFWTGAIFGTFAYPSNQFKRTGNVCDITKILEDIRK